MKKSRKRVGRPKGSSKDSRSFGPLGDLIRESRLAKKLGLADVADACDCSVQFISNMEHGRAPVPWDKTPALAKVLGVEPSEIQAANLKVRSDFNQFVKISGRSIPVALSEITVVAGKDLHLQTLLRKYKKVPPAKRANFVKSAIALLV